MVEAKEAVKEAKDILGKHKHFEDTDFVLIAKGHLRVLTESAEKDPSINYPLPIEDFVDDSLKELIVKVLKDLLKEEGEDYTIDEAVIDAWYHFEFNEDANDGKIDEEAMEAWLLELANSIKKETENENN